MTSVVYTIYGFEGCGYYHAALELLKSLASQNKKIKIQTLAVPRPKWSGTLETLHKNHKLSDTTLAKIKRHTESARCFDYY